MLQIIINTQINLRKNELKMGFGDKIWNFVKKVFGKALWTYSAYELGNNKDNTEKITESLVKYQNQLNSQQIINEKEQSHTLELVIVILLAIVSLFIIAICYKIFSKRAVNVDRQIRLETLRGVNQNNENNV